MHQGRKQRRRYAGTVVGMSDLWRDHDFALPAGHPSSWESECKQLRARVAELEGVFVRLDQRMMLAYEIQEHKEESADDILWGLLSDWPIVRRAALKGTKT